MGEAILCVHSHIIFLVLYDVEKEHLLQEE
jgi:hypothetical protein